MHSASSPDCARLSRSQSSWATTTVPTVSSLITKGARAWLSKRDVTKTGEDRRVNLCPRAIASSSPTSHGAPRSSVKGTIDHDALFFTHDFQPIPDQIPVRALAQDAQAPAPAREALHRAPHLRELEPDAGEEIA